MDMISESPALIKSRYLQLSWKRESAVLEFFPSDELTSGSTQRARQAIARVKSELNHLRECEIQMLEGRISARFPAADPSLLALIATVIDGKLDILRREKLTGRMVEEILLITSEERRRWTKEGRLPNSGTTSFKRGKNRVSLPLYSPEAITALAQGQNLLESWRAASRN